MVFSPCVVSLRLMLKGIVRVIVRAILMVYLYTYIYIWYISGSVDGCFRVFLGGILGPV